MKDFSQNGEQRYILEYFGDFNGTVLDIGANDGFFLSNSRALIELGWRALLVEPSPPAFMRLKANNLRVKFAPLPSPITVTPSELVGEMLKGMEMDEESTDVICVNAAITTQDGPIDLYDSGTHLKKGDVALLSTTVPKEMDRWKKSGEVFTKTTVRGIAFETLMKETGQSHFDMISIDAEGMDWQILQQIDLTAVGCRLLCVEVNNSDDSHFTQYAAKHGMRLLHKNYENRIYARD